MAGNPIPDDQPPPPKWLVPYLAVRPWVGIITLIIGLMAIGAYIYLLFQNNAVSALTPRLTLYWGEFAALTIGFIVFGAVAVEMWNKHFSLWFEAIACLVFVFCLAMLTPITEGLYLPHYYIANGTVDLFFFFDTLFIVVMFNDFVTMGLALVFTARN